VGAKPQPGFVCSRSPLGGEGDNRAGTSRSYAESGGAWCTFPTSTINQLYLAFNEMTAVGSSDPSGRCTSLGNSRFGKFGRTKIWADKNLPNLSLPPTPVPKRTPCSIPGLHTFLFFRDSKSLSSLRPQSASHPSFLPKGIEISVC